MKTAPSLPPAPSGSGYQGPAAWNESHPIVPDEFVCAYLEVRGVTDVLAESVAREASKAVRDSPHWHASAGGRIELHLRLFKTLQDAGHTSRSAELAGDLLKEMRKRREAGCGPGGAVVTSEPLDFNEPQRAILRAVATGGRIGNTGPR